MFYTAEQIEFMEALCTRCFGDRVFLCNSGAEATEAGMKLARRYQYAAKGDEDRSKIVAMQNSFHGRTMGAITATGQPKYQEGFQPLVPNFEYMPFNDESAVDEYIDTETAGVILEPVQGEGGIVPAERSFLQAVRERCDDVGAVLIYDEVQAGVGRTGSLFAYQGYDVEPDIMCLAKGIGGGTPLGAMVSTNEVFEGWKLGSHASTYGGNPLVCAAGLTVLNVIERDNLAENARIRGEQLRDGLRDLADAYGVISDVRGRGLMCGAEVGEEAGEIVEHARSERLIINTAGGETLRLVPPLIVSEQDVADALNRLDRAFASWRDR
jgi:predicted acetylornithine/succinylornithine family transaminase